MKRNSILLVIILVTQAAFAQDRVIQGTIQEAGTNDPVSFCNLAVMNTHAGTVSDAGGKFTIRIPNEITNPLLIASYIGYQTDTIALSDSITNYTIVLLPVSKALDEVVVTGVSHATAIKENPVSVSLVSSKAIQRTVESNIIDILVRNVPGLTAVKTGPNISKPFIRGLGYNRVLTLYDGIRQEGQQWGDEHGIEVDAYNIEKAEVIKGPSSLMFGSDALAGVVSMFPFVPKEKDGIVRGRFVTEYQSNNGLIGNGLRLSSANDHWLWIANGSYRVAKNYTNRIDGIVYNTGFNEKNASGTLGYVGKTGNTNLNLTLYDNTQGIPDGSRDSLTRKFTKQVEEGSSDNIKARPLVTDGDLNSYKLSALHQRIQHYRMYSKSVYRVGGGDMNLLLGLQQNIRREYNHPTDPQQPGLYVRLNTLNYGLQYNAPALSNIELSFGINGMYQHNKNKQATDFSIPDYSLLDAGSYMFVKWKYNRWTASGGVRYDLRQLSGNDFYIRKNKLNGFNEQAHVPDTAQAVLQFPELDQHFHGISLSVGATYSINEKISLKVNIARGYRAPNISEIASNGLDPGAHIVYIGNRNFVPEFSFQQDVGITGTFRDVSASLSLFNNVVQHYIYLSQQVDSDGKPIELVQGNKTFQYLQSSARLYGMEATLDIHPQSLKGFSFNSAFSSVKGFNTKDEFDDQGINGQYLPFIPPVKLLTAITQEIDLKHKTFRSIHVKADADFNAAQKRYLALYNTETPTASYTLFNLAAGTEINYSKNSTLNLQFQVNNVFDTAYQSNLSRLKYFEYYSQSANGHMGMYGMGRNWCVKATISF